MTRYRLIKTDSAELTDLKQMYLSQSAAPLDGMWESFVTQADHYSIQSRDKIIGYSVINSEQKLLQFFVIGAHHKGRIFSQVLAEKNVTGAFVNTAESQFLSLCMDHHKSVVINALMYHVEKDTLIKEAVFPPETDFRIIDEDELPTAFEFGIRTLGVDPDWLKGYFTNLIKREELFGLWQDDCLIATGECRVSDSQKPFADVGMIVSKSHRKQGLATNILRALIHLCHQDGLRPICSTEAGNIAAQKAIAKAGFISHHRILEIIF